MASSNSIHELTQDEIHKLAILAIEAKEKAYLNMQNPEHDIILLHNHTLAIPEPHGPYSNFRVGASVLLNHPINSSLYHTGSNVEIASTPVGICAERCALAPLVASVKRPDMPGVRAIVVSTDIWPPCSPCGMCRQFIREFCGLDTKIIMYGRKPGVRYGGYEEEAREESVVMTIGELLPMSFGPGDMDKREEKGVAKIG